MTDLQHPFERPRPPAGASSPNPLSDQSESDRLREIIRRVLDLRSSHDGHPLVVNLQAREMLQAAIDEEDRG